MKNIIFITLISMYICNINSFPIGRQIAKCEKNINITGKKYIVDIDGTICFTEKSNYCQSVPNYEKIKILNKLYEDGNEINYWTARGAMSGKNWDDFTINQLNRWNVKYTTINMDKPHYDLWIDDKTIHINDINIHNNS